MSEKRTLKELDDEIRVLNFYIGNIDRNLETLEDEKDREYQSILRKNHQAEIDSLNKERLAILREELK